MLKDYEWEFCLSLHKKLKEKVKGKVYTTVKEDILIVEVTMGKVKFEIGFENFSNRVNEGCTIDSIAMDAVQAYRNYLDDLYFIAEAN